MRISLLDVDDIVEIHQDQIEQYGGSLGLRDPALLESAVAQPFASFGGEPLHPTIPSVAAAYLYHLVMNHPFIDGNKRVGAAAAVTFLRMNGWDLRASNDEFEALVWRVAGGDISKSGLIEVFDGWARPPLL